MTVGVGLLATLGVDSSILLASAYAAVLGTGIGCVMQTTLLALQNRVEASDMGLATSTILRRAHARRDRRHRALRRRARGRAARPRGRRLDFADALPAVFLVAVPFGVISLLGALRLQEHPLREQARYT